MRLKLLTALGSVSCLRACVSVMASCAVAVITSQASQAPRQSIEDAYSRAVDLVERGALEQARDEFKLIVEQESFETRAAVNVETLDDALRGIIAPEIAVELVLSRELASQSQLSAAIPRIRAAIGHDPNYCRSYVDLGNMLSEDGKFEQSLQAYTKAQGVDERCRDAHYNQGVVLFRMGRNTEAVRAYTEAIKQVPDDALAYYSRGNARAAASDYEAAREDYTKALALDDSLAFAHLNRGNAFRATRSYELAIEDYQNFIQAMPGYAGVYFNLGLAWEGAGNRVNAIDAYRRFIELATPDDVAQVDEARRRIEQLNTSGR